MHADGEDSQFCDDVAKVAIIKKRISSDLALKKYESQEDSSILLYFFATCCNFASTLAIFFGNLANKNTKNFDNLKKCRPKKESALKSARQQAGRDERERERERECVCVCVKKENRDKQKRVKKKRFNGRAIKNTARCFSSLFPARC
jgi:hypothetical protein